MLTTLALLATLTWPAVPAASAQEPAPGAPSTPQDDTDGDAKADAADQAARAAGRKAFEAGAAAFNGRDYAGALTHYAEALTQFGKGWTKIAEADTRRRMLLQVWRARAYAHARSTDAAGFLADSRAALRLIGSLGGDSPEEQSLQAALFECLGATEQLENKLELLAGYRSLLEENISPSTGGDQGLARRLRMQIGQTMHEQAFALDRAGKLDEAATVLAQAVVYRAGINDLHGAAWSSQNLFWNLLRRREFADAAQRFNATAVILRHAPNVDIEGSLVGNLDRWLTARVAENRSDTARTLLTQIRQGAGASGGLPSLTTGRLCAMELAVSPGADEATRDARLALTDQLLAAGSSEAQPAWSWLAYATRTRVLLEVPRDQRTDDHSDDAMLTLAKGALRAAETLDDPHRRLLAKLLIADVLTDAGDLEGAEKQMHEVLGNASAEGAEPYVRELARRAGAALAVTAGHAGWAARYKLLASPKHPGLSGGQTVLGRTPRDFFRAVAALPGEGPVIAITRRGQYLIIRSALFPGTLAVEWSWRLRYVNANGLLLAIQGPAVAVIGEHTDLSAPKANNGSSKPDGEGNLDLALLAGEQLPALASQTVIPPGETAFVNKYLRLFR